MNITSSFIIGKVYSCRSACNYDCRWFYRVEARTAKRVTLQELINGQPSGKPFVRGIGSYEGAETCLPHGSYSMSPAINASRPV